MALSVALPTPVAVASSENWRLCVDDGGEAAVQRLAAPYQGAWEIIRRELPAELARLNYIIVTAPDDRVDLQLQLRFDVAGPTMTVVMEQYLATVSATLLAGDILEANVSRSLEIATPVGSSFEALAAKFAEPAVADLARDVATFLDGEISQFHFPYELRFTDYDRDALRRFEAHVAALDTTRGGSLALTEDRTAPGVWTYCLESRLGNVGLLRELETLFPGDTVALAGDVRSLRIVRTPGTALEEFLRGAVLRVGWPVIGGAAGLLLLVIVAMAVLLLRRSSAA